MSDTKATVYFARWVLCGDEVIENGAVRVKNGLIDKVGHRTGIRESGDAIVSLGERMLMPGMINLHTTLEEASLRGKIPFRHAHTAFLEEKEATLQNTSKEEMLQGVKLSVGELLANGITTTLHSIKHLDHSSYQNMPGRHLLLSHFNSEDAHSRFELGHRLAQNVEKGRIHGVTPGRFYSTSPQWLKEVQRAVSKTGAIFATHLAESADEMQAFSENSGELYDKLVQANKWFFDKGERGSAWYAISNSMIPRGSIIVNPCYCGADELSAIHALRATIAISPRYNYFFGLRQFPLELIQNRHLALAVITETPAVSETLNLLDELFEIRRAYPKVSPLELIKMVTVNPAKALKMSDRIGSITPGKEADLIAVEVEQFTSDPLEEIISGNGNIGFVTVRGEELIVP